MKDKQGVIYSISHPTTRLVFYIGQSRNYENRVKFHMRHPPNGKAFDIMNQISDLDLKPVFRIEKTIDNGAGDFWEYYFMSHYKELGHPITNRVFSKSIDIEDLKYLSPKDYNDYFSPKRTKTLGFDTPRTRDSAMYRIIRL